MDIAFHSMNIVMLQDDFPPETFGGAGIVAFRLAKALQNLGHTVTVITTVREKQKEGEHRVEGIPGIRIATSYPERWRSYRCLWNPLVVKKVRRLLRELRPDVIHVHNIHSYLSYACLLPSRRYAKAVVMTAHDVMLFHYDKLDEFLPSVGVSIPKAPLNYHITILQKLKKAKKRFNPFRNMIIRTLLRRVDLILPVSHALQEALAENGIKRPMQVVHNGIEVSEWDLSPPEVDAFKKQYGLMNKRVVLFAGRLTGARAKGIEALLAAMRLVVKQYPDAVLLVLGRKEGIDIPDPFVVLTGWIEGNELKAGYLASDVVVVPSLYLDPFPTVNLDAAASHKPVVGTCFGGTPEVVEDNATGIIVNPLHTPMLVQAIGDLLGNPGKARAYGEAGFARVAASFSLRAQTEQVVSVYGELLGGRLTYPQAR